ncbi:MAG TPA: hypothetical protein DIW64_05500 [Cellvibrio sp.]|nr:hypothetical protein [Cellvibrio sp.]
MINFDNEALMARISSAETRRAGDALFSATPPDLAQTYTPEIQNRFVQGNVLDGSQANIKKPL